METCILWLQRIKCGLILKPTNLFTFLLWTLLSLCIVIGKPCMYFQNVNMIFLWFILKIICSAAMESLRIFLSIFGFHFLIDIKQTYFLSFPASGLMKLILMWQPKHFGILFNFWRRSFFKNNFYVFLYFSISMFLTINRC